MNAICEESAVKEKPILFSATMVRAIQDGVKTQTRRVINWQKVSQQTGCLKGKLAWSTVCDSWAVFQGTDQPLTLVDCPYGNVGGTLWVRETWAPCIGGPCEPDNPILYRADSLPDYERLIWKPSIFMPRWASRITLEITNVRVERLQDISGQDAIAEGINLAQHKCGCEVCAHASELCPATASSLIMDYATLWREIHGKKHSWESNPFVWVIHFKRV